MTRPKLLSGGNPQIPKGEGNGPVRDYIAAMPGWKRDVGQRLDELIVRTIPDVHKAVKWNQPFYGHKGEGWFLSFRCYTNYAAAIPQRDIAESHAAESVQARRGALPRHPRGR
jgi:hypothetical protein